VAGATATLLLTPGIGVGQAHASTPPVSQGKALVIRMSWNGTDSTASNDLDSAITNGVNNWMWTASRGQFAGWTVTDPGPYLVQPPTMDPDPNHPCDVNFLHSIQTQGDYWAQALYGYNLNDYNAIVYWFPRIDSCGWEGRADQGGTHVYFNGVTYQLALVHEFGHHLGLAHSHYLDCKDANGTPVTLSSNLSSNCAINDYGDYTSEMGVSQGDFSAIQLAQLGWLTSGAGGFVDVPATGGDYDLQPMDTSGSSVGIVRAVRIQDGPNTLWVEYRVHGVLDPNPDDDGVFIHLQKPDGYVTAGSFLLPAFPRLTPDGVGSTPIPVGATWINPVGTVRITFNFVEDGLARITVSNPVPCWTVMTDHRALPIPDLSTVYRDSSPNGCLGNASGTATITVDITHTYVGDLILQLVAPSGTEYLLRYRQGGSADNIFETYSLNLSNESRAGIWRLKIIDAAGADSGQLNSVSFNL
jgi:hypothetical protein